jgi:hypothetical protein
MSSRGDLDPAALRREVSSLAAVNEIETLTTGLSRKVWQKIAILERPALSQSLNA